MKAFLPIFAILFVSSVAYAQKPGAVTSVYTDIDGASCKTTEVHEESGAATMTCTGVGGYKLLVHDDDARMSVTVVDPKGNEYPLEYWSVITSGFSTLGLKAEWRVVKRNGKMVPIALIVRVNTQEDPENPNKTTSYLAVAKISATGACVTAKIGPGAQMNIEARAAADASANKPCLGQP